MLTDLSILKFNVYKKTMDLNFPFPGQAPEVVIERAEVVVSSLDGNPDFLTLAPNVVSLTDAVKDAKTWQTEVLATGNRVAMAKRDAAMEVLIELLIATGNLVISIAQGNLVKLAGCGYEQPKVKAPSPNMFKPEPPKLSTGNSGDILSVGKRQAGVKAVIHHITEAPLTAESVWRAETTTSVKHTFTGCIPGKQYLVKQSLVGPRKQFKESDAVAYFAQ
jgi:hypothetical protein